MKSKIVLLTALVIGGCVAVPSAQNKQAQMEDFAWSEMCGLLELEADYQCMRLMPPLVVYKEMRSGLLGSYDGGDTIFIQTGFEGDELTDLLIHESIHYVHQQHQLVIIPGTQLHICWSENEAWILTGRYWNKNNSQWWSGYPHCWQFYANTQYLREVGALYNDVNDIIDDLIFWK